MLNFNLGVPAKKAVGLLWFASSKNGRAQTNHAIPNTIKFVIENSFQLLADFFAEFAVKTLCFLK